MNVAMLKGTISPENLIAKLCYMRFGGDSTSHQTQLRDELYGFRRQLPNRDLSRQAINNWLGRGGAPTRANAIDFLRAYVERISRDDLQSTGQIETYDQLLAYLRLQSSRDRDQQRGPQLSFLLNTFFGVGDHSVGLCEAAVGTYSLFFKSENFPDHIVHGSISFSFNPSTNSFEIMEHQAFKSGGATEQWSGYYLARKNFIIIILKGHGGLLNNLPKFYILYPLLNESRQVGRATGKMFKIGSGGREGIFTSNVLIRRDADAFSRCDVIPIKNIGSDIQSELGLELSVSRAGGRGREPRSLQPRG